MRDGEPVCFTAETIRKITNHCNSYIVLRNAAINRAQQISHLGFAEFCNNQAKLLHTIMGKPDETLAKELYNRTLRREITIGSEPVNSAFRELLGCVIGLFQLEKLRNSEHN